MSTNPDDPLPKKCLKLLVGVVFFTSSNFISATPPAVLETPQAIIIRGNALVAMASPPSNEGILASLTDFSERAVIKRIIFCESSNNPNAKNPNSSARGLLQVIESSERECEKALGRKLDMYNPADNLACGRYLYENGGLRHWVSSKGCWELN